ncbi:ammonia-dependent NAD(+) synthetase [Halopseudomonas pelagia]|uniref:NH(3)-dependent NAD(+) synthetase n=1 Tax=Halopseudomonas pelagia TaxID=553151 RepID=A0AA91U0M9_9GAMM|nr:ammonia-dependent NAD(+) synthetase [Halopseudomonas pelagia]PCC98308.1 NAD(+) synthase [Halopseudomonas pelagia]QFY56677.1 ammonia-dependent NAD(+) synthetase [Halopseudomonas pelagia]
MNTASSRGAEIRSALQVNSKLENDVELKMELERRIDFIKDTVQRSGTKALVLGISGGVDSTTCGKLCQIAVESLRQGGYNATFYAMRLPYDVQHDEHDAQSAVDFINPDQVRTVDIQSAVDALMENFADEQADAGKRDFVKGNVKARTRMVTQYALANFVNGLVVGTDHAAEAVMGFFTKFGDGACDLAPLTGLTKSQVRRIAAELGAPASLVGKVPTADLEELKPGRPDEDAYGLTYEQIDAFLLGKAVDDDIARQIIERYDATEHKRQVPLTP